MCPETQSTLYISVKPNLYSLAGFLLVTDIVQSNSTTKASRNQLQITFEPKFARVSEVSPDLRPVRRRLGGDHGRGPVARPHRGRDHRQEEEEEE